MGLEKIFGKQLAEDIEHHRDAVIKEMQGEDPLPVDQPPKNDLSFENVGGGLARDIERGKKMVAKDIRGKIEGTEK